MAVTRGEAPVIGKDALGRPVKDLSVIPWWGLDRKKIEWYPSINYDRCVGCGICFITCGRRVFEWDKEMGKPVVARPYNCMVGCSTCATLCSCDAIEFPPKDYVRRLVIENGIIRKAFEITKPLTENAKKTEGTESEFNP